MAACASCSDPAWIPGRSKSQRYITSAWLNFASAANCHTNSAPVEHLGFRIGQPLCRNCYDAPSEAKSRCYAHKAIEMWSAIEPRDSSHQSPILLRPNITAFQRAVNESVNKRGNDGTQAMLDDIRDKRRRSRRKLIASVTGESTDSSTSVTPLESSTLHLNSKYSVGEDIFVIECTKAGAQSSRWCSARERH